jgi:hypothetical protein
MLIRLRQCGLTRPSWSRRAAKGGLKSILSCALILFIGVFDGTFARLGRRKYAFLARQMRSIR